MDRNPIDEKLPSLVYNFKERQFLLTEMQLRSLLDKTTNSKSFHKYVDGLIAFFLGVSASLGITLVTVKGDDYQSIGALSGQSIHFALATIFWLSVTMLPLAGLAKKLKGKLLSSTDDAIQELVGKSNDLTAGTEKKVSLGLPITMGEIPSPSNESGHRPLAIALDSPKIEPSIRSVDEDANDENKTRAHNLEATTSTEIIRKSFDKSERVSLSDLGQRILLYMVKFGLSDTARICAAHGDRAEVLNALRELDKEGLLAVDGSRVVITAQGRIRAS